MPMACRTATNRKVCDMLNHVYSNKNAYLHTLVTGKRLLSTMTQVATEAAQVVSTHGPT